MQQPKESKSEVEIVQELSQQTDIILAEAQAFKISTAGEYTQSADFLKRVKAHQKTLESEEMEITGPINKGLKRVRDLFRTPRDRAAQAESLIKRAMLAYQQEQDAIRRKEQAAADEAARKEREKLAAQAAKAAASGKTDKADKLEQRAATVVAPIIHREPPKVAGVSMREVYKFEVTDENLVPREFCDVSDKKIRAMVNAMKGATNIPGVRVYKDTVLAAGSA